MNMVAHGSPEDRMKGVTVHDSSIDSYKKSNMSRM